MLMLKASESFSSVQGSSQLLTTISLGVGITGTSWFFGPPLDMNFSLQEEMAALSIMFLVGVVFFVAEANFFIKEKYGLHNEIPTRPSDDATQQVCVGFNLGIWVFYFILLFHFLNQSLRLPPTEVRALLWNCGRLKEIK